MVLLDPNLLGTFFGRPGTFWEAIPHPEGGARRRSSGRVPGDASDLFSRDRVGGLPGRVLEFFRTTGFGPEASGWGFAYMELTCEEIADCHTMLNLSMFLEKR